MRIDAILRKVGLVRLPKNETAKQKAGREGEDCAEEFLRREKGFRTIVRNWKSCNGEIDLVCWDRDVMVFVEVKTRAEQALVPGYYAVDRRKKKILRIVFGEYLKKLSRRPSTFRFDIVEVAVIDSGDPVVRHFENIPLFPKGYHW